MRMIKRRPFSWIILYHSTVICLTIMMMMKMIMVIMMMMMMVMMMMVMVMMMIIPLSGRLAQTEDQLEDQGPDPLHPAQEVSQTQDPEAPSRGAGCRGRHRGKISFLS